MHDLWHIPASNYTKRCHNPIRGIVEGMDLTPNPELPMIALSVGDPTIFGNIKTDPAVLKAVVQSIESLQFNGYAPSTGYNEAKEAIAKHVSTSNGEFQLEAKDVIICSGCSHALEMCITVLADKDQNILIPRPGFPIYKMIAECLQIKCKYYDLLPDKNWQVDLDHLESQIDENTAAIIVNNPSNPCGSVFSKTHLLDILRIASKHYVPIIADEIYDYFVFKGKQFHPLGSLSKDVPILTCGGLTKRFLVPGWRLGWIITHDRHNAFEKEISKGLLGLSQRIMGSNTLIQGALPTIFKNTPSTFFDEIIEVIEKNAKLTYEILSTTPGLRPIMPEGAMYMMVEMEMDKFPEFQTDLQFVEKMVAEQSVFCLPGGIFEIPGYVRIVITIPEEQMRIACIRIKEFCVKHYMGRRTLQYTEVSTPPPLPLFGCKILKSEKAIEDSNEKHYLPNGFRNENESLQNFLEKDEKTREM